MRKEAAFPGRKDAFGKWIHKLSAAALAKVGEQMDEIVKLGWSRPEATLTTLSEGRPAA